MVSEVLVNTVVHSLPLQRQRAQPLPAAAALGGHLRSSLTLCGTCPAHDSSTVRVFSISQFLCFAQILLFGVSAVLSVNKKNSKSVLEITVGVKDIWTTVKLWPGRRGGEPHLMGCIVSTNRLAGEGGKKEI